MSKNISDLRQHIVKEWNDIPQLVLIGLIRSMKRHCELIIEGNGDHISY